MGILDGWKFCPRCSTPIDVEDGRVLCAGCGFVAYANSVPGAQALVEDDGRVLLGRRTHLPSQGLWDIPGGFLAEGEAPLDGLRREVLEETGCTIDPVEFLGFWTERYEGRYVLCLTWLVRRHEGEPRPGDDLAELRWFGRDELPTPEELAFPTYVEILALWRERAT